MHMVISVNKHAMQVVKEVLYRRDELRIRVEKRPKGATIVDAGVAVPGGYAAGLMVTRICMAGLCEVSLSSRNFGDFGLPTIGVATDQPAISTLGAQFAGWQIKVGDYFAMGSGPARALALKPKELYAEIDYKDDADCAVIVLESEKLPPDDAIKYIASECNVRPSKVYAVVTPTNSLAGSTQISGRIVETGVHKLEKVGLDPKKIIQATGYAPISPIHPKSARAMGRTNDALYYGGETFYTVNFEDDEKLKEIVSKAPSSTAAEYGKPFYEIFKAAGFDFYKIDPNLFAPAVVAVNNIRTGQTFRSGQIDTRILKETMGIGSI
jgi:methenyltetrahydromethanopterin cyclohydrolase